MEKRASEREGVHEYCEKMVFIIIAPALFAPPFLLPILARYISHQYFRFAKNKQNKNEITKSNRN